MAESSKNFAKEASDEQIRTVIQLLSDYRAFFSPFGGATPLDSTLNLEAAGAYGPAGLIFAGTEFDKNDRKTLRKSFRALAVALALLQREECVGKHFNGDKISGSSAHMGLIEPYLADPADPSIADDWRAKTAKGYKSAERFLERHDAAVKWIAQLLINIDLYAVFPKLMSEQEETEIENKYAEMYAVFCRLRRAGLKEMDAISQTAENYPEATISVVERVVEFRSENKLDTCTWGGCERTPFSQELCLKHYQQTRRAQKRKKGEKAS